METPALRCIAYILIAPTNISSETKLALHREKKKGQETFWLTG